MKKSPVELHIEELVLNGFPPEQRYQIAEAVQTELQRLFTDLGLPASMQNHLNSSSIDAGEFRRSSTNAVATGNHIAGSVYSSLKPKSNR